jgi:hypothetical protein
MPNLRRAIKAVDRVAFWAGRLVFAIGFYCLLTPFACVFRQLASRTVLREDRRSSRRCDFEETF